jgi:hypothetical protein
MGSQHKKKKGTDDTRIIVADIKRDADQDAIRTVIQTGLEFIAPGSPRAPLLRAMIDFVNVTETIDPSQTPS